MLDYNRRPSFADRVNAAVDQALKDPQVIERLAALGVMPKYLPADKFSTLVQSNYKQYGDILKPLGLTQ